MKNPTSLLSGRKVRTLEEEEEREIMPLRVATMFMHAAQGQREHSAQQDFSIDDIS